VRMSCTSSARRAMSLDAPVIHTPDGVNRLRVSVKSRSSSPVNSRFDRPWT
jgi:hypothetical protein